MKRFAVFLTPDAEEDIASIHDYIEEHESTARADRTAASLFAVIGTLSEMPMRGSTPREIAGWIPWDVRELHHWSYRIFYLISGSAVSVFAVVDGRRDMQDFLARRLARGSASR